MNIRQLYETCEDLFSKRWSLMLFWQELAENFYIPRADFTVQRTVGTQVADHLSTSYPLMVCRDLKGQLGAMLRPESKEWFYQSVEDEEDLDNDSKAYLQYVTKVQRRAMYDRATQFTRAADQLDGDYAAFGQGVMTVQLNREADALLYRTWHLRDCAWTTNERDEVCDVFRKWKPGYRQLQAEFAKMRGATLHQQAIEAASKKPFDKADIRHMLVEADHWDGDARGMPYVSIYYDVTHDHTIIAEPYPDPLYVIPRWQTYSESQYAYSPASIIALPDARLLQAMTATLLDASEKAANPPMIAVQEAIRSDVALYAGGITWADADYDERLGEVLRPLTQDARGIPIGIDMQRDTRALLHAAFYLNKLQLPERAPQMTAYEIGQRVQQYIRDALPLFKPTEDEYSGQVCERSFSVLQRAGTFGSPWSIPEQLKGRQTQFRFRSPLHDAIEEQKGNKLLEAKALLAQVFDLDPGVRHTLNARDALRDALHGIQVPAKWLRGEDEVEQIAAAEQQAAQQQVMMANMQQGADVAQGIAAARKDFAAAPTAG